MRLLTLLACCLLLVCLCLWTTPRSQSAEVKTGALAAGKNVPGSFHPFNVTERKLTEEELEERLKVKMEREKDRAKPKGKEVYVEPEYSSRFKFHCLVTEYDLDPVVMLFARGLYDSAGFKDLLKSIDRACDRYRVRRLRAFVVFIDPELKQFHIPSKFEDIVKKTDEGKKVSDKLFDAVTRVEKFAGEFQPKLDNVVLTIGATGELARYELSDEALTVVAYRALRIRGSYKFAADELDQEPTRKGLLTAVEKALITR
jgi:hypothetical protein